jgi:hypothetical protein
VPGGCCAAASWPRPATTTPSPTPRPSSPVSRPTGPPTASGRPAVPSRSTWPGTSGTPTCSGPTGRAPASKPGAAGSTSGQSSWSGPGGCASSASSPPPSRASAPGGRLSAGSSSTGSATRSSTPTGRSAQSLAIWTWSSAATIAPLTRQSSASTSGSAPWVIDGATGTSTPTPTSHAPDPAEEISLAQPELMSASAEAVSARPAERPPAWEHLLYTLKAGPAGGLRPPSAGSHSAGVPYRPQPLPHPKRCR